MKFMEASEMRFEQYEFDDRKVSWFAVGIGATVIFLIWFVMVR